METFIISCIVVAISFTLTFLILRRINKAQRKTKPVTVKRYTTESIDDETTQTMKWRLGYREEGYFVEIEGNYFFQVLYILLLARRRRPKGKAS